MDRTIAVTGQGRVVVVPDVADVRLGVAVTRPSVAEARQAAAERAASVLAALTDAGVARADVRTVALTLQPEIDYAERTAKVLGQQVSHQYLVTVRDLERLGAVIDGALAAGATTLDGVTFRSADAAGAERRARIAAMQDARDRAEVLAGEAGVRVGEVISIAEGAMPGAPRPLLARMAMADAAPTPVEAGIAEVDASVLVTFAIAP